MGRQLYVNEFDLRALPCRATHSLSVHFTLHPSLRSAVSSGCNDFKIGETFEDEDIWQVGLDFGEFGAFMFFML